MRLPRRTGFALVGGLAAAAVTASLTSPAQAAAPTWKVTKTFNNGKYDSVNGVLALSRTNAWAFAGGDKVSGDMDRPLAYHWNGKAWSSTALPKGLTGHLWYGTATSASNVWAAGGHSEAGGTLNEYVVHWDGKKWSLSKQHFPGYITGLTAFSAKNVWLFGQSSADVGAGTWHYNGHSWTKVKLPFYPVQASATSAKDMWTLGRGANGDFRTIAHYNGTTWKTVSLGNVLPPDKHPDPYRYVFVDSIHAVSAHSVWATACIDTSKKRSPVLLHWNGKAWQKSAIPGTECVSDITPDGRGGLFFNSSVKSGSGYLTAIRHRTKAGKWSITAISGTGKRLPTIRQMSLIPGTTSLWGVGDLSPKTAYNSDGAIFSYKG
jgi:hypothetical protein